MSDSPKVFISYSHDDQSHKKWVKELAVYLRKNGIDAILDQWDMTLGSDLAKFMERGLSRSERVLVISTDNYIAKANSGSGGVGYEKMIATAELLAEQDTRKFIPVIRNVTGDRKLPIFLGSRLYIDLSQEVDSEEQRIELLRALHKAQEAKPEIGANPFVRIPEMEVASAIPLVLAKPSLRGKESTIFFSDRFASAFPGCRGIDWFEDQRNIALRLGTLLEEPLDFNDGSPIWWWRKGNLHVHSFSSLGDGLYLMDSKELRITKIAAVNIGGYYQQFVYIETEAMEKTGLYRYEDNGVESCVKEFGYCWEEYGIYKNEYKVNRSEYDDDAAYINGELVKLGADVEFRYRYITPYNFLIAAAQSPINNSKFDEKLGGMLNQILVGTEVLDNLAEEVLKLPKR